MGEANVHAAQRREWARIAHDALHELDAIVEGEPTYQFDVAVDELLKRVHDALHHAVDDDPPPADSAATDLRPFDRAFASLAREHGVQAVWIAAHPDGTLKHGGEVQLNEAVAQIMHAGMSTIAAMNELQSQQQAPPGLYVPEGSVNGKLIIPGQDPT